MILMIQKEGWSLCAVPLTKQRYSILHVCTSIGISESSQIASGSWWYCRWKFLFTDHPMPCSRCSFSWCKLNKETSLKLPLRQMTTWWVLESAHKYSIMLLSVTISVLGPCYSRTSFWSLWIHFTAIDMDGIPPHPPSSPLNWIFSLLNITYSRQYTRGGIVALY